MVKPLGLCHLSPNLGAPPGPFALCSPSIPKGATPGPWQRNAILFVSPPIRKLPFSNRPDSSSANRPLKAEQIPWPTSLLNKRFLGRNRSEEHTSELQSRQYL